MDGVACTGRGIDQVVVSADRLRGEPVWYFHIGRGSSFGRPTRIYLGKPYITRDKGSARRSKGRAAQAGSPFLIEVLVEKKETNEYAD